MESLQATPIQTAMSHPSPGAAQNGASGGTGGATHRPLILVLPLLAVPEVPEVPEPLRMLGGIVGNNTNEIRDVYASETMIATHLQVEMAAQLAQQEMVLLAVLLMRVLWEQRAALEVLELLPMAEELLGEYLKYYKCLY